MTGDAKHKGVMAGGEVFPYSVGERHSCLDPLEASIRRWRRGGGTAVIGIQGGQGTGKTTLSRYLVARLAGQGIRTVAFSLDDFYTGRDDRLHLADRHRGNPFYSIPRGMPGTHRTTLLTETLDLLKAGHDVDLPVFDKSAHGGYGDIAPRTVPVRGRQDVVFFEGWFTGMPPGGMADLQASCRRYEIDIEASRPHLEAVLAHLDEYVPIWARLDHLVLLRPDSPRLHEQWRLEQEQALRTASGSGLSDDAVRELVRRFLPLSCLSYDTSKPDLSMHINARHQCYALR